MVKNLKKGKRMRWFFIIITFFVILVVLSFFALGPLIKNRLVEQVAIQTNDVYSLEIRKLDVNIFMGDVSAYEIDFMPDPAKKRSLKEGKDIYTVKAPQVNIHGMSLWKLLFADEVNMRQLDIIHPEVQWEKYFDSTDSQDSVPSAKRQEKQKQVPPVHIGRVNLSKLDFQIMRDSTQLLSLNNASLRIDAFSFKNNGNRAGLKQFDFDEFTFFMKDYEMVLPDSLYALHFDSLKASYRTSSMLVNGLQLIPLYNNKDFMEKEGEQADRINLYNKALYISNIDFKRLKEKEALAAGFVEIDSLNMFIFRDKRYVLPANKFVKLPQQLLREAPFYINIDSLLLQNAQITYRERVEGALEPGTINFTGLEAKVYNITNDPSLLENAIAMKAKASAYLMGTGKIEAAFHIPIANPNNAHYFTGSLSPMNMEIINPMLKHIVFGEIVSGQVNELNFSAQVNETASQGTMHFGYDNLKIQINNKDSEKGKKGIMTFLANTFIVKSANPINNKFRESEMYYVRDKRKSIINFWWKTLLSGIKETIGIPKKEEEQKPQ